MGYLRAVASPKGSSHYEDGGLTAATCEGHSGLKLVSAEDSPLGGACWEDFGCGSQRSEGNRGCQRHTSWLYLMVLQRPLRFWGPMAGLRASTPSLPAIGLLIPVHLRKAPPLSCLHFPICKTKAMTMPSHKLAKHPLQSSDQLCGEGSILVFCT